MEVREAGLQDVPQIVTLLKSSLGESLMPKSEQYWQWKHLDNPFGPSPVLLCFEGELLIGVRAFMRWEWRNSSNNRIFKAVRAVDTATHPQHQGKGVFKKLTMQLVKTCTDRGEDFVFNTPNSQSKPGYIKMGWIEAGRLPITMSIQKPFSIVTNLLMKATNGIESDNSTNIRDLLNHPSLDALIAGHGHDSKHITTNLSAAYLRWRYLDVPVASYIAVGTMEGGQLSGLMIGRLKASRIGNELRITELLVRSRSDGKILMKGIKQFRKSWNTDYTTLSGIAEKKTKSLLSPLSVTADLGPIVTIRQLAVTDLEMLKEFKQWSPSLGDLELF